MKNERITKSALCNPNEVTGLSNNHQALLNSQQKQPCFLMKGSCPEQPESV